jgi:hypothetical protein
MDASLETLVVAGYVFACSLSIPRPGPVGLITDQELIALAVAQAVTGLASDRQFLWMVRRLLPGWFSHLPEQTQFNRRLRRLTPQITRVQPMVAELIAEGEVCLVDGTLISCANYPGCAKHSSFAPDAAFGYCPSKSRIVWGMRLVVICDRKGVPIGYDLVGPKTGEERESAFRPASAHPHSRLFADGGFWGREYEHTMELIDGHTPGGLAFCAVMRGIRRVRDRCGAGHRRAQFALESAGQTPRRSFAASASNSASSRIASSSSSRESRCTRGRAARM